MKFIEGTYGIDLLSLFLLLLGSILNIFDLTRVFGFLFVILAIYRAFSKKTYKRKEEFNSFYFFTNKILNKFGKSLPYNLPVISLSSFGLIFDKLNYWLNQKKNFKITKCPNCKQKLRLPRGKGKIVVTCKKCTHKFDLKT